MRMIKLKDLLIEKKSVTANKIFEGPADFEKHILDKYAYSGQSIGNLRAVYNNIFLYPKNKQTAILNLFKKGGKKKAKSGSSSITASAAKVYDLCKSAQVSNGDFSELWFAVQYNGEVKGGVAGTTGIVSDVDLKGGVGVSLKNYTKIKTVNFGSLPNVINQTFQKMLKLFQLLADKDVNVSQTIVSINKLLVTMSDTTLQKEIQEIIKLSASTKIPLIKRIGTELTDTLGGKDVNDLVDIFVTKVNDMVKEKIEAVDWWGIIEGASTVYLESNTDLYTALESKDSQLNTAIGSFQGGNLRIKADKILKAIK